MFRASPWISYQPADSKNKHRAPSDPIKSTISNHMDHDVDMDTPQISALHEEESPPPQQPTRTSKFRVKLLVNDTKALPTSPGSVSTPRKSSTGTWEEQPVDDDEDEEDQLVDDDDDQLSPPKRRSSNRKRPKKSEKRVVDDDKKDKVPSQALAGAALDSPLKQDTPPTDVNNTLNTLAPVSAEPSSTKIPLKRAAPSRGSAPQRAKGKAIARVAKELAIPILEDGNISESYTGTAASSPVTFHPDGSPEPEAFGAIPSAPSTEYSNLDSIPLPVYPLPQKPFPVQPLPKMGSGFAPIIPLDKSDKRPRRWRVANREIRGIAGGRWFARTWVGEKDSELAMASASKSADGMALPKLSSVSIAAVSSGKGSSKLKSSVGSASHSRASSTIPDRDRDTHATRAPTRMRSSVVAAGGNDSDMAFVGP